MSHEQLLQLLLGAVTALLGVVWTSLREKVKAQDADIAALRADVQGKFDRMGERFDARQQALLQDVAVLKAMQGHK